MFYSVQIFTFSVLIYTRHTCILLCYCSTVHKTKYRNDQPNICQVSNSSKSKTLSMLLNLIHVALKHDEIYYHVRHSKTALFLNRLSFRIKLNVKNELCIENNICEFSVTNYWPLIKAYSCSKSLKCANKLLLIIKITNNKNN